MSALRRLLDGIQGYSYEYKDPSRPGAAPGKQFGPMAQDLERAGPVGAGMVANTPQGKMVDGGRAGLAALGGLANLNKRLARIEVQRKPPPMTVRPVDEATPPTPAPRRGIAAWEEWSRGA